MNKSMVINIDEQYCNNYAGIGKRIVKGCVNECC